MLNMIAGSLERLAVETGTVKTDTGRNAPRDVTAESVKCQNPVGYAPAVDVQSSAIEASPGEPTVPAPAPAPESTAPGGTAKDVVDPAEPALAALKAALLAAGHDPGECELAYQEKVEFFPGGDYVNKDIVATFSDGTTANFNAELTAESPYGVVLSIEHALRDIAAGINS
ncbi:MAG: hypothetical protein M1541_08930 [Acidobacteria bacterium]|nr:hypothetical protein [Acidobacteriota bacterium]